LLCYHLLPVPIHCSQYVVILLHSVDILHSFGDISMLTYSGTFYYDDDFIISLCCL
jgi:hypothetical protein